MQENNTSVQIENIKESIGDWILSFLQWSYAYNNSVDMPNDEIKKIKPEIDSFVNEMDFIIDTPSKSEFQEDNNRIRTALQKMCEAQQHLFDMKKQKGSTSVMKNAWNIVSINLYEAKQLI